MKLYNKLIEINSEIDIFFDPKHKFEKKNNADSRTILQLIVPQHITRQNSTCETYYGGGVELGMGQGVRQRQ